MGGDGMGGLALAIALASLCMLAMPVLLGGGLGYLALRRRRAGWLGALLGAAMGLGLGVLAVTATFFESTWSPPLALTLEVPPGFSHEWVLVIADPAASATIEWHGADLPFTSQSASLAVPASGIVRVRSLGRLDGDDVRATLSTGAQSWGRGSLNSPPGIGSGRIVVFGFVPYPGTQPDPSSLGPDELAALIRSREATP